MRAAVLTSPRTITIQDVPTPRAGAGEVIVRVMANALCGSDVHAFQGTHARIGIGGWFGHELAGVVAEVGPGGARVVVGQRVAVDSVLRCHECVECLAGHSNRCLHYLTTGSRGDGGLAEQIRLPTGNIHPIPDTMSFDQAALVQPLAIAHHAVSRNARVKAGDVVSVVGAGPVGLLVMVLCNRLGATVVVSDPRSARADMARSLGAAATAGAGPDEVKAALDGVSSSPGADHVFDCVGGTGTAALETCLNVARRGGIVTILGTYAGDVIALPNRDFTNKEIYVRSSRSYTAESYAEALAMASSGEIEIPDLVSHVFPLEATQDALTRLDAGDPAIVKAVIRPSETLDQVEHGAGD